MSLTCKLLTERFSVALSSLSGAGFRYYRSFQHFRRTDPNGFSYISINSITHNHVDYHLDFLAGVRNDPLESTIKQVLQSSPKLTHFDRSLLIWTAHIGPNSPNWDHPVAGTWLFRTETDVERYVEEVIRFVESLILPFLNRNTTSASIRQTLLELQLHAQNQRPYQQILAADILAPNTTQFEADYSLLSERYIKQHPPLKAEFNDFCLNAKSLLKIRNARTHSSLICDA